MSLSIQWTARALKDARQVDRSTRERILRAIELLAETERGDVTRLHGEYAGMFRLRVGAWRVIFSYEAGDIMTIHHIRSRG